MSKVLDRLKASTDPLENDLAMVYEHWQERRRANNLTATLGYEPRDLNALGTIEVISSRVLKASSGFEDVDKDLSYEALVLRYPDRFTLDVIEAATERIEIGSNKSKAFKMQDIQFFIKSSSLNLFSEPNITSSVESWLGRTIEIPQFKKENEHFNDFLILGARAFIWLHEEEKEGERGNGLTGVVQFGSLNKQRQAKITDVLIFDKPVGRDLFEAHKANDNFISLIDSRRHTRIWPLENQDVDLLLNAVRAKLHQIDSYLAQNPDPSDPNNLETIENETALREVVLRRNQSAFRSKLFREREARCAISGTSEINVLEAAHIIPFSEQFADRDKIENGLLLRSDIHKLYDLHLISINPNSRAVEISPSLSSEEYKKMRGNKVQDDVFTKSLNHHYNIFLKNF